MVLQGSDAQTKSEAQSCARKWWKAEINNEIWRNILRFQMYRIKNYRFEKLSWFFLLNPTFHFQMVSYYFLFQIWCNIISYFRWCQIVAFPESYREYFTRPVVLSLILAIWVLRWCPFQQKILNNLAIWDLRCYCPLQQQKCAEEAF